MPTVITVIMRLVGGEGKTRSLRGTLRTLEDPEPRPFGDETELTEILHRLVDERCRWEKTNESAK